MSKKETLRSKADAKLNEDLEARKVQALARLTNEKRRHEAAIKDIEAEMKGIEESPLETSFIGEGESFRN